MASLIALREFCPFLENKVNSGRPGLGIYPSPPRVVGRGVGRNLEAHENYFQLATKKFKIE